MFNLSLCGILIASLSVSQCNAFSNFLSKTEEKADLKIERQEQVAGEERSPPTQGLKGDYGTDPQENKKRVVRDVLGYPGSQQTIGASPQFTSAGVNYQAAYFMGSCVMCPPGHEGSRGPPGPQGVPGRDGRDGRDVAFGFPEGVSAPQIPSPDKFDVNYSSPGVPFTRWGRPNCPTTAVLVYAGVVAGGHYTHKGSGSNPLCISKEPEFNEPLAGNQHGAYIYGAEYETFPKGRPIIDQEVPCAVCMAPSQQQALMVPGIMNCPSTMDWTKQYHGYIMASHISHTRGQFICIDHEAEGIPRTAGNENGLLFYTAEVQCESTGGGLPCPPYSTGYELTCVVCTI